ncbi:MAG: 50S ribosomal protein L3 [Candidatus Peregrinibacteria bacterium]|nr:50S ribosomal protein L3 [Candidatus Peregrinibacteria bacterium]MCB9807746.1 50S ribosomal protein L3 [Candidatus Peribacteria bacterium]
MCNGIIAKKVGMSRVFNKDTGDAVPVTYLQVEPNTVVRTKSEDKDGYNAVVLGVKPRKWKTRKGKEHVRYGDQKEFRVESLEGLEAGKQISCEKFVVDSKVSVVGSSKGRGFQGVIKRYGFAGGPATHGSHFHRRPGSVGMKEWPGRVLKGKKLPGRMGNQQVTLRDRTVMACDTEKGLIAIKGPIPGPNGSSVYLTLNNDN